jgi:hypothetical protein
MDRTERIPDGWVAIVRLLPYRVDWRVADGEITAGATIARSGAYEERDP